MILIEYYDLNKKEIASRQRVLNKLENSLGGIRKMSQIPDIIFVMDTKREKVAIAEANKLGIPVIALLDSNSNPHGVDYPIPCNDDNAQAVALVCQLIADAILVGMEVSFAKREANQRRRRESNDSSRRNYVRNDQRRKAEEGINTEEGQEMQQNEQTSSAAKDEKPSPNHVAIVEKRDKRSFIQSDQKIGGSEGGRSFGPKLLGKKSNEPGSERKTFTPRNNNNQTGGAATSNSSRPNNNRPPYQRGNDNGFNRPNSNENPNNSGDKV